LAMLGTSLCVLVKKLTTQKYLLGQLPNGGNMFAMYSEANRPDLSDVLYSYLAHLPNGDCMYIYFSDDGMFAMRTLDGTLELYETDISSCDASNGFATKVVMLWLAKQIGLEVDAARLVALAAQPTVVRNPDSPNEYVRLRPQTTYQYSGEGPTTLENNISSTTISYGIYMRLCQGHSPEDAIIEGARDFGWVLTVAVRHSWNAITFLKRAYSIESRRSWSVYGPIFRSLGLVDGELTSVRLGVTKEEFSKMSYSDMFEKVLLTRVEGLVHEPGSVIINALRSRVGFKSIQEDISVQDIIERYGGEEYEIHDLCDKILSLKLGDVVVSQFLERIFSFDYGTTCALHDEFRESPHDNVDELM